MKFFEKDSHQHDDGTVHSHKHRGTHTHDKKGKMIETAEYSCYLERMTKTSTVIPIRTGTDAAARKRI